MTDPRLLTAYCDDYLAAGGFDDYAPNGLQVEGSRPVERLVSGVTACAALIDAAVAAGADALLVHHGWFWKNESPCLVGVKGHRAKTLINAGLSLIAYHLPLDAHPLVGNNAMLGQRLGLTDAMPVEASRGILWTGRLDAALAPDALAERVGERLGRQTICVAGGLAPITTLAWCTGGGQRFIEQAAALGVDAFITGEISEQTTHLARELGITFIAAGHHATERDGVRALGDHLAARFGVAHRFIDIDNPA